MVATFLLLYLILQMSLINNSSKQASLHYIAEEGTEFNIVVIFSRSLIK